MDGGEVLTLEGALSPGWTALVAGLLLAAAFWSVFRARVPARTKAVLFLLRAVATAALAFALLGPVFLRSEETEIRPPAMLLLDASQSMSLPEEKGDGPTRRETVLRTMESQAGAVEGLTRKYELSRFDYGKDLVRVPAWTPEAEGALTASGEAVSAAARRMRGRSGGVIVLVSDGRTTSGADPVRAAVAARARGVRVHTVGVGRPDIATVKDRMVNNLLCPSVAQTDTNVPIRAVVGARGDKGSTMRVSLTVDGLLRDTRELVVDRDRFTARVEFLHRPEEPGEQRITVDVNVSPDEFDPDNNTMTTFLRVRQRELRVLYLEGKLRWEFTFLKRTLASLPGAHFETHTLFGGGSPPDAERLAPFNVIMIGDVSAEQLGEEVLATLEQKVRQEEAGLLFLAGPINLGEDAGWAGTPMEALLPFDLEGSGPPEEKAVRFELTESGRNHFALVLDEDRNANAVSWSQLTPLEGRAVAGSLKPAATALARSGDGAPLLVVHPYGKGRVMAFLAETAWRWVLASPESGERYRRFWHQCVFWLARKERGARRLMVELPRYLYIAGDPVEVTAIVENPPGRPVPDASVEATIEGPGGGARSAPATFYGGTYHALFSPDEPGDYRVTVKARRAGDDFGEASARFTVIAPSAELDQPSPDPETLMAVASAGGGVFRPLGEIGSLFEQLAKEADPVRIERTFRRPIWDRPWLVLLFVAALGAEWILRKWNRLP